MINKFNLFVFGFLVLFPGITVALFENMDRLSAGSLLCGFVVLLIGNAISAIRQDIPPITLSRLNLLFKEYKANNFELTIMGYGAALFSGGLLAIFFQVFLKQ